MLVRGGRRYDADEAQVGDGEIQQQQVGDGAHVMVGQDDVDDETIAGGAEQRNDAVLRRCYDLVEEPRESVFLLTRRRRRVEVRIVI